MTRKEKELKVLETFGLKIGDRVKLFVDKEDTNNNFIVEIVENEESIELKRNYVAGVSYFTNLLFIYDWEKLKPSLKDSKCRDFDHCEGCPIQGHAIYCCHIEDYEDKTIEYIFNTAKQDLDKIETELFGDEK